MGIRNFPVVSLGENTAERVLIDGNVIINLSAIPTEGGSTPKFVLITVTPGTAAGNVIMVSPTFSGLGSSPTLGFPIEADRPQPLILDMHGFSRIAFVVKAGGDTTSFGYAYPLEDF